MIGSGMIDAMIKSMKQNRSLLGKRKSLKEINQENPVKSTRKYTFKKSSPERIAQLRMELLEEKRRTTIKLITIFFVIASVVGVLAYVLLFT